MRSFGYFNIVQEVNVAEIHSIRLVEEAAYTFASPDNSKSYGVEIDLTGGDDASSTHGLMVDGEAVLVVRSAGGATGVHEHSAIRIGEVVYFAVGPHVCRHTIGKTGLDWSLTTDTATCFGVHYSVAHDALISHGELEIARFNADGRILWSASGADIFSEVLVLNEDFIEATDYSARSYYFDYSTGKPAGH